MAVKDIAIRVQFSEASNFRKAFRKWTGCTPADFRARSGAEHSLDTVGSGK